MEPTAPRQARRTPGGAGRSPWHVAALLACAAALLVGLGDAPLMDPDESRCGEIAREMLARCDGVSMTLNDIPYYEKPPLMYWLVAGSISLLGPREQAVRIVPALLALLGMAVAWWLALLTGGRSVARWAPAILATTACVFAVARVPIVDMLFSVTLAAALTAWLASARAARPGRRLGLAALAGAALGLAVLAKGPVALVLAVGALIAEALLLWAGRRGGRSWADAAGSLGGWPLRAAVALLTCAAVALPWFLAVAARDPEFLHYYFTVGHFERYTGGGKAEHQQPLWYYAAVVPAGFLPWSVLWIGEAWRRIRLDRPEAAGTGESVAAGPFLAGWALAVPAFFSLSACKLPQYALPAFWPLAVWTAALAVAPGRRPPARLALYAAAAALPLIAVGLWRQLAAHPPGGIEGLDGALAALAVAWLAAAALCAAAARLVPGEGRRAALVAAACCVLVGLVPGYRAVVASSDVGPVLPPALRPADPAVGWTIAQYRCTSPALNFYTRARAVSIDTADLRGIGYTRPDAEEWFPRGEETIDRLSARGPLALITPARIAREVADRHGLTVRAASRDNALLLNAAGLRACGYTRTEPPGGAG